MIGVTGDRAVQGVAMATHPTGSGSAMPPLSEWNTSSPVYHRSQMTAAVRAALIALALLAILAVIVLL